MNKKQLKEEIRKEVQKYLNEQMDDRMSSASDPKRDSVVRKYINQFDLDSLQEDDYERVRNAMEEIFDDALELGMSYAEK